MMVVMMMMMIFAIVMMMVMMMVPPPVVMMVMVMMMVIVSELYVGFRAILAIRRGSGSVCDSQNSGSVWNRIEQLAV